MNIRIAAPGVALVEGEAAVIVDENSALDLMATVHYEFGVSSFAIAKALVAEPFFVLSSGLAGAVLQKFVNYGVKLAIYGDYSHYTSKPLKDFIYESNRMGHVFFVATLDEAIECLGARG